MKARLENTDDDKPAKMTTAERESRLYAVKPEVKGLQTNGVHDPAHCSIDLAAQMVASDVLVHLPLEKCPTREQGRKGAKIDAKFKKTKDVHAALASDYDLHNALVRRGLAVDMGNLSKYTTH